MSRVIRLFLYLAIGTLLGGVSVFAMAQTPVAGAGALFADLMAKPSVAGTMGITEGIIASNAGNVGVTTSSGRLSVPTTASATVSKAAIGAAAVKLVRAGSVVGAAYTTYEVYTWIKDSGIKTCAPPDFFCKPGVEAAPFPYIWRETQQTSKTGTTPQATCLAANAGLTGTIIPSGSNQYGTIYTCAFSNGAASGFVVQQIGMCQTGYTLQSGTCVSNGSGTSAPSPYTDLELASGLIGTGGNWDPARGKALYTAIKNDMAKQPGVLSASDLMPSNSPATVTSAPVVGPTVQKQQETIQNQDGTTSTRTTTEQQTVTPTVKAPANGQPATVSNPPTVTYPVTTITTVTTTNNTTNVSSTTNTTAQTNGEADEDKSTLCKLLPDILACAKLGTPTDEKMPTTTKNLSYTPDSVQWGAAASCPAPVSISLGHYGARALEFTAFCDVASQMRPFILAGAAASAMFMLFLAFKV